MTFEPAQVRAARKDDHVDLAAAQRADTPIYRDFDDIEFIHHALGGVDAAEVSLDAHVGQWVWASPFYINGMTGGTDQTATINRELAIAARETSIPMACGSVSIALDAGDNASVQRSFAVIREENPGGFVMANLGVGRPADDAARAVELLEADALQVHLNAVQETVMPEGSRDFSSWQHSLEALIAASPVPVVVKEVGFGLSRRALEQIANMGGRVADVSGTGGTDFLRIENARRDGTHGDFSIMSGFGQSAPACLLDAPLHGPDLLASGGVRHPFDVVKALALGARAVGVAGTFLETVRAGGSAALVPLIRAWQQQTIAILALLGARTPAEMQCTDVLVRGRLAEFSELRGIDLAAQPIPSSPVETRSHTS
jgi:isopentenyl-diphosphate delta-isomerase